MIKQFTGYVYSYSEYREKGRLDVFFPTTFKSRNWRRRITHVSYNTCLECYEQNGKIYPINEPLIIPVHPNCQCETTTDIAIEAGTATVDGINGADYWLKHYGELPDYYISRNEYYAAGWSDGKSPAKWFPGKMMYGGIYLNDEGKLPDAAGRIWYEADINYHEGRRNSHRIYFSNDGLIFVTYDHTKTFLNRSNALLCSQGAELANDCKQQRERQLLRASVRDYDSH